VIVNSNLNMLHIIEGNYEIS